MMPLAMITFPGLNWLWPAAIILVLALALVAWSYGSGPVGGLRWVVAALKLLGVAALTFCLLEPLWSGPRARPGANLFAVVVDNSQSLRVKDRGETQTRAELLKKLLTQDGRGWQEPLAEHFDLRQFAFDARLNALREFNELTFDGRASALGSALRGMAERFAGQPLAGILLFTDGNATDLRNQLPDLAGLPPVYPVLAGHPGAVCDLAIAQVQVSDTVFEDAPVSLQADVAALGLAGETIMAQVLDSVGRKIGEQTLRARKDDESVSFRFRWRPERPGLSFCQVRVGRRDELAVATPADRSQEATLLNNWRVVAVEHGRGPYRVLYVSGRPNWEYKFLNRAAQEDDQLQLVALIRVARREPKFEFRGREGETSNPLFRGFGEQSREKVERYDQPVLTRLNTSDEQELRAGFPRLHQELYRYHAVILDDVEAEFFAPDQAALLQEFVSQRGGGLLMLGGLESFQQGNYQRTPIGDLLPVYLERPADAKPAGTVKLNLAREGWLQPWARLRDNERDEQARLQAMPPFAILNRLREVKPGACVVASATDAQGKQYPALVTQRFGRGRTAALMVGDLWRWGMRDPEARRDLEKSWRQLLRWLVADVPRQVELAAEPGDADTSGAVRLQVRARDQEFQPLDDAAVTLQIQPATPEAGPGSGSAIRFRAEPSAAEAGLYQASCVLRSPGGYRATAWVTNSAGLRVGQAEAGWSADSAADEFRSLQPNLALLEHIAQRTGGEVIPLARLSSFVRNLPARRAPVMEPWTTPLWHTPLLFGLALACFVAEWGLRRWKGLP
jgi:uncharacterized membrane protein